MEKKHRSPSYPQMGIKEAVEKIGALYKEIGAHATSREVVAKGLGYRSISGTSATTISTLNKYGLLDGRGDEVRVSDRAMAILHPHSDEERKEALRAAALEPELFRDIAERFPGGSVNDELLRNYLLRNKFSPQAVEAAILAYKETIEFVSGFEAAYDSAPSIQKDATSMHAPQNTPNPKGTTPPPPSENEQEIAGLGFKGVGFIKIMANQGLDPKKALAMAKQAIGMMEAELKMQENPQPPGGESVE